MRNLIKRLIILLSFCGLYSNILYSQITHVFGLTEYYYLTLVDKANYEMKIGMYGDENVTGEYEIDSDTLLLKTFNFTNPKGYLSKGDISVVKQSYSRYLKKDSILMPLRLLEVDIPRPSYITSHISRDSIRSDWYILSDGHVTYRMKLRADSIFSYYTGSDIGGNVINGKWSRKDNFLFLYPESEDDIEVLDWICTDLKMLFHDKFLIGKDTGKNKYMYLLKR